MQMVIFICGQSTSYVGACFYVWVVVFVCGGHLCAWAFAFVCGHSFSYVGGGCVCGHVVVVCGGGGGSCVHHFMRAYVSWKHQW